MVAAENPNLSADTLTVPLLHVAQDPALSQQVLPSLMSSGVAMATLTRVITNSPELAGHIADRIRAGNLVGPAAKGLQSIPAVRSQLVHQFDQAIMTDVLELPLPSGKTLPSEKPKGPTDMTLLRPLGVTMRPAASSNYRAR
jgi:hypothetical protein